MTIRQTANEEVAQYAHRFKKLLRKVNGRVANQALPAQLQVRMFLYGLNPILTPLVSSNNPADLDAAIVRAKIVETGYNYVPTKEVTVAVPATITQNPPLANPIPTPVNNELDQLTQQMQQLSLNYATLTSALLAQTGNKSTKFRKSSNNEQGERRDSGYRKGSCFNCGKPGHYSRECPSPKKNDNNRGQRVHYAEDDDYYEYDPTSSEDEYEVFVQGLSESSKERKTRKRVRTGDEMDENAEYIAPPEVPSNTPSKPKSRPKEKGARKFHLKPAPIERVSEFDIAQYIGDLPCGLSIGQASAQIPKY
jgi:hypothetical protein